MDLNLAAQVAIVVAVVVAIMVYAHLAEFGFPFGSTAVLECGRCAGTGMTTVTAWPTNVPLTITCALCAGTGQAGGAR